MRRKNLILIDNLKRKLFIKYEIKNKLYQNLLKNNYISNFYKYQIFYKKLKLNKFETTTQTVNRCFKSSRK